MLRLVAGRHEATGKELKDVWGMVISTTTNYYTATEKELIESRLQEVVLTFQHGSSAATEKELKVQWKLGVLAVKVESKCSNWERIGGRGSWRALWSRGGGGS